jgi:holdfast attachment protein HfaA
MRVILLTAAAAILAVNATAQDGGGWGDSSAAVFNAPKGYGSQAEFNGSPKGSTRDANGNRTIVNGRYTDNCYYNVDGVTPGVGSRSKVTGTPGFPQNPCANGTAAAAIQNQAIGNNVTVVTTGHWNTVVVDTTQTNNGDQSATLNGGLNLD